jgi:hypothetical protein
MKSLLPVTAIALLLSCNKPETPSSANTLVWAEDIQTVLPMESDTISGWPCSDFTNAKTDYDKHKLFNSITAGILSGKVKAYMNYPNDILTVDQVKHILVEWDSTIQVEDPNNPGTFIYAPVKMEVTPEYVPLLKFHEKILLDTVTYSLKRELAYITLYTYKTNSRFQVDGSKKLFDVKFNEPPK